MGDAEPLEFDAKVDDDAEAIAKSPVPEELGTCFVGLRCVNALEDLPKPDRRLEEFRLLKLVEALAERKNE